MQAHAKGGYEIPVVKDAQNQGPIPSTWRSILAEIIAAFVRKDYRLNTGIPGVAPVSATIGEQIQNYIRDYGATLIDLPESTWDTSVCIWGGNRWDVLIDLSTQEEGSSDLVLQAHILETNGSYVVHVYMVYVP
ncbi:hypothetical protein GTP58_03755 [Duganella sp. CY15W]|uniref:DUF7668 domain-containing protein n=1 Tax=Duganella sp. CY15W TaxID=2692172 RepID=UPI00136EFB9A|nr:hypothetical protein [Duganella sp. CY15W]MYM27431.1 hypothetical protein [Duganella sp. CY15W]